MKILFISATTRTERPWYDPAARYRCYNLADELAQRGHKTLVVAQKTYEANAGKLDHFDIYVFHRPIFTETLARSIGALKRNHLLIADYDDLVFDSGKVSQVYGPETNHAKQTEAFKRMNLVAAAAALFDNFVLSTDPLKEAVNRLFNPARSLVVHNGLSKSWCDQCRIYRLHSPFESRKYIFGYFPGTGTHARDLGPILNMLLSCLRIRKEAMLLQGMYDLPDYARDVIEKRPLISFLKYPHNLCQCKYVLAPLEENDFNKSKSAIKFMEASQCGCVTLATPIPDIDRFESDLLVKCRNRNEWEKAVTNLPPPPSDVEASLRHLEGTVDIAEEAERFIRYYL